MKQLFPALNAGEPLHRLPDLWAGRAIPRLVHRKCSSKADLPSDIVDNLARLQDANPDWEHRLYDDDDAARFVAEHYPPEVVQRYHRISPQYGASKADLFRYLLLYQVGGVYLDLKSSVARPLSAFVRPDDAYLLGQWQNGPGEAHEGFGTWADLGDVEGGEFQQWHIIAAPGHPFLKAVIEAVLTNIDRYDPWLHGTGRRGVLRLTGPIAYTRAIAPIRHLYPHRYVTGEEAEHLVYSVIDNTARVHTAKNHYTGRTDSVVILHGPRAASAHIYSGIKKLYRLYMERGHAAPEMTAAGISPNRS